MQSVELKIIQTSDIHGCFFPYDFIHREKATGSLSRIHYYVKSQSQKYKDRLILLDCGDILQGQPSCQYNEDLSLKNGDLAASIYNYMGYDAITIGNHDIEAGHAIYDSWRKKTQCQILAANILDKSTGKPYFTPYIIIERQGVKIALLGMVTQAIPYWLDESLWSGMEFEDIKNSSSHWIKSIKDTEEPDLIIGMFHSGWDGGISNNRCKENVTRDIAENVDGFDIILYGHDHTKHAQTIINIEGHDVVCINPSSDGKNIGEIDIKIYGSPNRRENIKINYRIKNIEYVQADASFMNQFKDDNKRALEFSYQHAGTLNQDLYTKDCYFGCAPFSDFIHHIQLSITKADISFTAPLAYDESFPIGEIFNGDLFKVCRYENKIYSVKMTGKEIKDYLEMSYELWIKPMNKDSKHIMKSSQYFFNGKTYTYFSNLTFNFDCAAGIDYTVDATKQKGNRINIIKLSDGREFNFNTNYNVAMHSYRGNGGTEFLTKGSGIKHEELHNRITFRSAHDMRFYIREVLLKPQYKDIKKLSNWRFIPDKLTSKAIVNDRKLIFNH